VTIDDTKYPSEDLGFVDRQDEVLLGHMDHRVASIKHIGGLISEGSISFLRAQYKYLAIFICVFSVVVGLAGGTGAAIAFVVGSLASILAGYIGMRVATFANIRTTHECWLGMDQTEGLAKGYRLATLGGSIVATSQTTLGVLSLFIVAGCFKAAGQWTSDISIALANYSFGASSIGLFTRVGGGIYTKAADIGADLSGKSDFGLMQDDFRNPACIADNVGDNVGGVVGIGADLFSSFAAASCAALLMSADSGIYTACKTPELLPHSASLTSWKVMMYPLLISASGLVVSILAITVVLRCSKVKEVRDIEKNIKQMLVLSAVIETLVLWLLARWCLPASFDVSCNIREVKPMHCVFVTWLGLWSALLMAYTAEYYTSLRREPVRTIAEAQLVSAATGIIYGLAVGYLSTAAPVCFLAVTILVAHALAGPYGIALAGLGMLSVMTICLTIDAYDTIADNAIGIAEMSGVSTEEESDITDVLGGAGAVGNGFAIGAGALVSTSVIGAFALRAGVQSLEALDRWYFTGLFLGAMLPYAFSAITMISVATAANDMIEECKQQHPSIISGEKQPDYDRCIKISTTASLQKMGPAGLLVIGLPIAVGWVLGRKCTTGLLQGALVSGVQMGISMINTGGAWDNAKKYVAEQGVKDSEQYKNSVIGDIVGDPLKDVSGPALNVLVNVSAITSLVFSHFISQWSASDGGPWWH